MAKRTIPLATIRAECHRLVGQLVKGGGATQESLAHLEPGGRDNPDPEGYLRWYALLNQEWRADQDRQDAVRGEDGQEDAEQLALAMLARLPVPVQLSAPVNGLHVVEVHPKGLTALMALRTHDEWLERLAQTRNWLADSTDPKTMARLGDIDAEMTRQVRLLVEAVCHPGPRLPWDVVPDAPAEWTADLSSVDVLRIRSAHLELNLLRFDALKKLAPTEAGNKPAQWSTIVSSASVNMGIAPSVLMGDWTVGELLTAFRLSGEAQRKAQEKARAR